MIRPEQAAPQGFRPLPGTPIRASLRALASALQAGDSFCLSDTPLPPGITADPDHFLTLSGGSTGRPKYIIRSMRSWIASFEVNANLFGLAPPDRLAVLGQLTHSLALYGVIEGLFLGLETHVLAQMPPSQQATLLRKQAISLLYATPTQLRLLCRAARGVDWPDLRVILCGGGTLEADTVHALRRLAPNARLHQFYGAAETSFITMTQPNTPPGSIGPAYPGVTLRILDAKGGLTDAQGEIWVRSPYLFDGYAGRPIADTRWQNGFVSVGEMGQLDPQGNLYLTGRRSRLVNIADQLVSPDAVEAHLAAQPGMPPCAVLPLEDRLRGTRLVLIAQGTEDPALARQLRQSCRDAFGALVTPARVLFIDELPLLPSGKTDLQTLTHWLEART